MNDVEKQLRSLLKGEFTSLSIEFNRHKAHYDTAAVAIRDGTYRNAEWVSIAEKQNAIEKDSVWTLQWYPDTPIGFYELAASSLDAVIRAALEYDAEEGD